MLKRLKDWRQRRKDEPAERKQHALREFVYLDEVSVTSLLSSRLGAIPSEFTDAQSGETKGEISSNAEANVAVFKSGLASRLEVSRSQNSQILSKATIQTSFKQLYEMEERSLALAPIMSAEPAPSADAVREFLETGLHGESLTPWVADPDALRRGQLAEIEVELHADPAFRVSAIVTAFKELAEESAELLGNADRQGFEKAIELNRVLEKLMGNLVPIKCRLANYEVIQVDGRRWLLHKRALDQIPRESCPTTSPLFLVGVTEQSSYWKDIRRVLFSRARFRALCRLNFDGLRQTWTPVKMVDVLSEVAPALVHEMDIFGSGALKVMLEGSTTHGKFVEPRYKALVAFGEELARFWSIELDDEDRHDIETLAAETTEMLTSVPESRKAFTQISDQLAEKYTKTVDNKIISTLRVRTCQKYGLYPGGSGVRAETVMFDDADDEPTEEHLDAEIVAIYW